MASSRKTGNFSLKNNEHDAVFEELVNEKHDERLLVSYGATMGGKNLKPDAFGDKSEHDEILCSGKESISNDNSVDKPPNPIDMSDFLHFCEILKNQQRISDI